MIEASSFPEFGDFDDKNIYERCHAAAVRADTRNFVIEFDSTKAYAAHDLSDASIEQLLKPEVNDSPITCRRSKKMRRIDIVIRRSKADLHQYQRAKHSSARWMYVDPSA